MSDPTLLVLASLAAATARLRHHDGRARFPGSTGPGTLYGASPTGGARVRRGAHRGRPPQALSADGRWPRAPAAAARRARAHRSRRGPSPQTRMSWWIRFIARLYPRSWRQRYGAELDALIEDTGPGWRVAMDLARGAAIMHVTMGLAPLRQHVSPSRGDTRVHAHCPPHAVRRHRRQCADLQSGERRAAPSAAVRGARAPCRRVARGTWARAGARQSGSIHLLHVPRFRRGP